LLGKLPFLSLVGRLWAALVIMVLLLAPLPGWARWLVAIPCLVWLGGEALSLFRARHLEPRPMVMARSMRHSFMNHLQVISGWLQVNRPDKAASYLATASERITEEGKVLSLSDHRAAEAILEALYVMSGKGISYRVQVNEAGFLGWPRDALTYALKTVAEMAPSGHNIQLDLDEASRTAVVVCPGIEVNPEDRDATEAAGQALAGQRWCFQVGRDDGLEITVCKMEGRWWRGVRR